MQNILDNIAVVRENIKIACEKAGRKPEEVELIAVTKTVNIDIINFALKSGISSIGENKAQEIMSKYDYVSENVKWHLIGHLQTNKVKYIIDKVDLIHSVDSISLAEEINKKAEKLGKIMEVLIQVNVAKEESKFGINLEEVDEFVEKLVELKNIKVRGLMTIAPFFEDTERVRPYFRRLKEKLEELKAKKLSGTDIELLSMGMTNDYIIAIEEGANLVRVGTGIFGERDYSKKA